MRRKGSRQRPLDEEDEGDGETRRARLVRLVLSRPLDSLVTLLAAAATTTITVNALFLQPGPHPAPIFAIRRAPVSSADATGSLRPLPRPRPGESSAARPDGTGARGRSEIVGEIQKELARRGFYDGPVDGVYGAKTDGAIRDFEQAAGLKASPEPNEALLHTMQKSSVKAQAAVPMPPARPNDPIANLIAPTRQVVAIQRALSDFGYGQIKPTGTFDADTRAAIERFERERQLPVTGQISDRLRRELTAVTGRPLE
ncbi:MAG TPA: peptidoglycan-binding protein [Xanthobacteraceae bacterium]|nr:peptidoglycan-binding protein [Xanthobacteraceae bacterium]